MVQPLPGQLPLPFEPPRQGPDYNSEEWRDLVRADLKKMLVRPLPWTDADKRYARTVFPQQVQWLPHSEQHLWLSKWRELDARLE